MPFACIDALVRDALNSKVTNEFSTLWRAGLLHPGDKQRKDAKISTVNVDERQDKDKRYQRLTSTKDKRQRQKIPTVQVDDRPMVNIEYDLLVQQLALLIAVLDIVIV